MPLSAEMPNGSVIVNSRTGQRMRFETTALDVLRIECWSPASSCREPAHTHPRQESKFEVLEGELTFEVDGTARTVPAPGTITIPAGVRHRFWNASQQEAHYVRSSVRRSAHAPSSSCSSGSRTKAGSTRTGCPALLDLPVMVDASVDVIRPTSPPWTVLRLLAAIVRPIAALRGRTSITTE